MRAHGHHDDQTSTAARTPIARRSNGTHAMSHLTTKGPPQTSLAPDVRPFTSPESPSLLANRRHYSRDRRERNSSGRSGARGEMDTEKDNSHYG